MTRLAIVAVIAAVLGCGKSDRDPEAPTATTTAGVDSTPPAPGDLTPRDPGSAADSKADGKRIPTPLDPAKQKLAADVLDADPAVRERATDALLKLKHEAIPYLLEVFAGDDGMPRKQVAEVLAPIWQGAGAKGVSFDPAATDLVLEALTYQPSLRVRRGAALCLYFHSHDPKQEPRVIKALQASSRDDGSAAIRDKSRKVLGMIADSYLEEMLAPDAQDRMTDEELDARFKAMVRIGEPALEYLDPEIRHALKVIDETVQLERIRRGIGGAPNPIVVKRLQYLNDWLPKAEDAARQIRKADKP